MPPSRLRWDHAHGGTPFPQSPTGLAVGLGLESCPTGPWEPDSPRRDPAPIGSCSPLWSPASDSAELRTAARSRIAQCPPPVHPRHRIGTGGARSGCAHRGADRHRLLTEGEPARMLRHRGDAVELLGGGIHVDSYPVAMARDRAIRIEQLVAAPRAEVWDNLADLSSHGQWCGPTAIRSIPLVFPGSAPAAVHLRGPCAPRITWSCPPRRIGPRHTVTRVAHLPRGALRLHVDGSRTRVLGHRAAPPVRAVRPLLAAVWRANLRRFAARFA